MTHEHGETEDVDRPRVRLNYAYPPDFNYCPLSEPRVVKLQILNRSRQDKARNICSHNVHEGILKSSGTPVVWEDVTCTYIDLDTLIDTCGQSDLHRHVLGELMKGYSVSDIAENDGVVRQTIASAFNVAVYRIVQKNNENWRGFVLGEGKSRS